MCEYIAELHGLSLSFKDKIIFSDFSAKIRRGCITGISGDSGRGKTTLLRILAGLQKPDRGEVVFSYNKQGYVFQDYRLLPWMSVMDNIILPVKNEVSEKEASARALKYLDVMCLSGCENLLPGELSGGMAQRVSLVRAMTYQPEIIFMDEPFSALDHEMQSRASEAVKDYAYEHGISIVFVSHNLDNLRHMSEDIIEL